MKTILKTHEWQLKVFAFIAMLIGPFGAYFSVVTGQSELTFLFLGFMCLVMLLTMKVG